MLLAMADSLLSSSGFCWLLVVVSIASIADASPSNLRGGSDSFHPGDDLSWAKEWLAMHPTDGPENSRRMLMNQLAHSLGVKFCQPSPEGPVIHNNFASIFANHPTNGWQGSRLATFTDDAGINVVKTASLETELDGPEMELYNLPAGEFTLTGWIRLSNNKTKQSFFRAGIHAPGETVSSGRVVATALAKTECWTKVSGGFTLSNTNNVTLKLSGVLPSSSLYLASFAVQSKDSTSVLQQQNSVISKLRQRDVVLQVVDSKGSPAQVYVEMDQTVSDFPFGGAASGSILVSPKFQRWFKKRFTWAVYQNEAKWYYTEPWQGAKNYNDSDNMLALFHNMGITVRGHNIFWDVAQYQQSWIQNLNQKDLAAAVANRLSEVVSRYKGKFVHWDVMNEMLHGNFYESRLGNKNFAGGVYRKAKSIDPAMKTFVNDYNVVETYDGSATPEIYLQLVSNIEANGGIVDRIGVEGHFHDADGPRIKSDLDALATGGIPIWLTEVDIDDTDPQSQADKLETVMRVAFSHPAVEGIMFWTTAIPDCKTTNWKYVDPSICSTTCYKCLTDGFFNDRPIGKRYVQLRKEWSTHKKKWLKSDGTLKFRGFFGKYRVKIHTGKTVQVQYFSVPKGSSTLNVKLKIT